MAKWKGFGDSRPETSASPKAGKIDCTGKPKKVQYQPTGSEVFGDRRGGTKSNWKGLKDSRP